MGKFYTLGNQNRADLNPRHTKKKNERKKRAEINEQ